MPPPESLKLIGFVLFAAISVAAIVYTFLRALSEGSAAYSNRFTRSTQATLEEMLVFIPPSLLMNMKIAAALGGAAIGWFVTLLINAFAQRVFIMTIFAIPAFFLPDILIKRAYKSRLKKFQSQMVDGLRILANCLKANISFEESLRTMAAESAAPMKDEIGRVVLEMSLGAQMTHALEDLASRVPLADLRLFVSSVNTIHDKGGGLAEICEKTANLVSERFRVERQIETLTSEGKTQSMVLCAAPFALMIMLFFIDPSLVSVLFSTFTGLVIIMVTLLLDIIGFLIIRRITNIQV